MRNTGPLGDWIGRVDSGGTLTRSTQRASGTELHTSAREQGFEYRAVGLADEERGYGDTGVTAIHGDQVVTGAVYDNSRDGTSILRVFHLVIEVAVAPGQ